MYAGMYAYTTMHIHLIHVKSRIYDIVSLYHIPRMGNHAPKHTCQTISHHVITKHVRPWHGFMSRHGIPQHTNHTTSTAGKEVAIVGSRSTTSTAIVLIDGWLRSSSKNITLHYMGSTEAIRHEHALQHPRSYAP